MSRDEARAIYDRQLLMARTFKRDIYELCEQRGVPRALVTEFLREDKVMDKFVARHTEEGDPKTHADQAASESLKAEIRRRTRRDG